MTGIYKLGAQNAQLSRVAFCQRIDIVFVTAAIAHTNCSWFRHYTVRRVHALSPTVEGGGHDNH